ncbi:hypothetical protein DL93DRAFT_1387227 [Clavulina sp. PMI_390]|nr:hypothetical protein DL93DRAFT_1387227 [Clavulina sp. PMI_390]
MLHCPYRVSRIIERLLELDWDMEDIRLPASAEQVRAYEFDQMLYQPTPLSESIWKRIRPRLEEILLERKELRLSIEAEREKAVTEGAILRGLQTIAKWEAARLLTDPRTPGSMLPGWVEDVFAYAASHHPDGLSSVPSVAPLLDPSAEPFSGSLLDCEAYPQIRSDVARVQKKTRHSLAQLIRDAENDAPFDDTWKFGEVDLSDDELDAMDQENLELLLRPSSLFCVPCHSHPLGYALKGYPRVLVYGGLLDYPTTVAQLSKTLPIAKDMTKALGLKGNTHITLRSESFEFYCGSCPMDEGQVYSWGELVEHYVQEQQWFHHQKEENLAQGIPWRDTHSSYQATRLRSERDVVAYEMLSKVSRNYDDSAMIWNCSLCPTHPSTQDLNPRFIPGSIMLARFPTIKEVFYQHMQYRHDIYGSRAEPYAVLSGYGSNSDEI